MGVCHRCSARSAMLVATILIILAHTATVFRIRHVATKYFAPDAHYNDPNHLDQKKTRDDDAAAKKANFLTNEYRSERRKYFPRSWYVGNKTDELLPNADVDGPILDFVVVGQPKCGTTTVSYNLAKYAPMDPGDVCTPPAQTVYYSYVNWPKKYGDDKKMRGSKCPQFIENLCPFDKFLPRTKLIVGIRHPVLWFESFWNQQASNGLTKVYYNDDPYNAMYVSSFTGDWCKKKQPLCLGRARFQISLARMRKTDLLDDAELHLLAPNDPDGGANLAKGCDRVRNPVFLYEMNSLKRDRVWDDMATFLGGVENGTVAHDEYQSAHGRNPNALARIDVCDERYDELRAKIMPYAYNLSVWLQEYFVPVAANESRPDVVIGDRESFVETVESYKHDPCVGRNRTKKAES